MVDMQYNICPHCKSNIVPHISLQRYQIGKSESIQIVKCLHCNLQWEQKWTAAKRFIDI